ncbi:MAG: SagB/ThcOx family dehydrogenase [Terriglobales bacterium]
MNNRELHAAWKYHDATKHSAWSVRNKPHFLDWQNQPLPFKIYPELETSPLPRDVPQTGVAALSAIVKTIAGESTPSLRDLARILYFSAGITKTRSYPGGEIYFRAAACTGALYEIELYVICGDLADLAAGVYHFGPADMSLRLLRKGDYRGNLARATASEPAVSHAPATIVCTGTYWRNGWKYQARTYRHFGWDNGTLLANLLATATASGLSAEVVLGFVDEQVNSLLALDAGREVAFSLVAIGRAGEPVPPPGEVNQLDFYTVAVSRREVVYPEMLEMHEASSLAFDDEVRQWREEPISPAQMPPAGRIVPLMTMPEEQLPQDTIEQVILRRGSTRQFDNRASITLAQLSTILERSTGGVPSDFLAAGEQINDLYLIVHAVEGLTPGSYVYHRHERGLELLKEGSFRGEASYLGLEQELPGDACVAIFFLADLQRVLERYGNRGYRAAQLEAGVIGGRMYLATYAQRLGATGLTFFDDDAVQFFSPHAQGKNAIFLVAVGRAKRA